MASEHDQVTAGAAASVACQASSVRLLDATDLCRRLLLLLQTTQIVCANDKHPLVDQASQTDSVEDATSTKCVDHETLRTENETLAKKLRELVDMNVRWQRMYSEQQAHLLQLKTKLDQERTTLQTSEVAVETEEDLESRGVDATCNTCDALRQRLADVEQQNEDLQQNVTSLTARLDSATTEHEAAVEMLRAQVIVYQEDFEAERKDRERAQSQLSELENQFQLLQNNMQQAQQWRARSATHPVYQTDRRITTHYNNTNNRLQQQQQSGRMGTDWDLLTDGVDELDGPLEMQSAAATDDRRPVDAADDVADVADDVLRCPKCLRQFPLSRHAQLMQHIDDCGAV